MGDISNEGEIKMTISFMILETDVTFSKQLQEIIEHKLAEETKIKAEVITADTFEDAMDKRAAVDIHVVNVNLNSAIDYIRAVSKTYSEDEPVIPVIVLSSYSEDFYRMEVLNELKVISYIEKDRGYRKEHMLQELKRAVKCVKSFDNRTVTFSRPTYQQTYKEKNVWCIKRLPHGQKKIIVTIYDEANHKLINEQFSIKSSLGEVLELFSSPDKMVRCHQSWLVNPKVIIGDTKNDLVLLSGLKIPIGGEYRDNVESYYVTQR